MNNLLKSLIYDGEKILSESGVKNAMDEARLIIKKTLKKNELEFITFQNIIIAGAGQPGKINGRYLIKILIFGLK